MLIHRRIRTHEKVPHGRIEPRLHVDQPARIGLLVPRVPLPALLQAVQVFAEGHLLLLVFEGAVLVSEEPGAAEVVHLGNVEAGRDAFRLQGAFAVSPPIPEWMQEWPWLFSWVPLTAVLLLREVIVRGRAGTIR